MHEGHRVSVSAVKYFDFRGSRASFHVTGQSAPKILLLQGMIKVINLRLSMTIADWHIVPDLSGCSEPEAVDHSKRLPRGTRSGLARSLNLTQTMSKPSRG